MLLFKGYECATKSRVLYQGAATRNPWTLSDKICQFVIFKKTASSNIHNAIQEHAQPTPRECLTAIIRKMLPPILIFKGNCISCIVMHEFGNYPEAWKYACQEKARINESKMHKGIDVVLKLWKATRDVNNMSPESQTLFLMHSVNTKWDLLIKGFSWCALRWFMSLLDALTCTSPLTWRLMNSSNVDYKISGRSERLKRGS